MSLSTGYRYMDIYLQKLLALGSLTFRCTEGLRTTVNTPSLGQDAALPNTVTLDCSTRFSKPPVLQTFMAATQEAIPLAHLETLEGFPCIHKTFLRY